MKEKLTCRRLGNTGRHCPSFTDLRAGTRTTSCKCGSGNSLHTCWILMVVAMPTRWWGHRYGVTRQWELPLETKQTPEAFIILEPPGGWKSSPGGLSPDQGGNHQVIGGPSRRWFLVATDSVPGYCCQASWGVGRSPSVKCMILSHGNVPLINRLSYK